MHFLNNLLLRATLLTLSLSTATAAAQDRPEPTPADLERAEFILRQISAEASVIAIRTQLLSAFSQADVDGVPGLSERDAELLAEADLARARSRRIGQVLVHDLDGNLAVDVEEVAVAARIATRSPVRLGRSEAAPSDAQREIARQAFLQEFLQGDTDGDGGLSTAEIRSAAEATLNPDRARRSARRRLPPATFDRNSDGSIAETEYANVLIKVLRAADIDGNGRLERAEVQALRSKIASVRTERDRAEAKANGGRPVRCMLPDLPRDGALYILQATEGSAMTNLRLRGRDVTTTLAEIVVPEGAGDIRLLTSFASPVVLRLTGPGADRVRLVVSLVGELGVTGGGSPEIVRASCPVGFLGMTFSEPGEDPQVAAFRRRLPGRDFEFHEVDTLGRFELATGRNDGDLRLDGDATPPDDPRNDLLRSLFLTFNPGGLQLLDPHAVRATAEVTAHEILPQEAGLLQLMHSGAIEPVALAPAATVVRRVPASDPLAEELKRQAARSLSPDPLVMRDGLRFTRLPGGTWVGTPPQSFRVTRAVTLPAGLDTPMHSVRIVVPDGVPHPKGPTYAQENSKVRPRIPQVVKPKPTYGKKFPQIGD